MPLTTLLFLVALQAPAPAAPTRAAAQEQLAQAEARYRAAIAATPAIAAYHESLALVLEREERPMDALAAHQEAVRLDSLAYRNRAGLGLLLLRLGRTTEAIDQLHAAAAIDRSSVEVRKALATAYRAEGRRDEALESLREAARLDSTDSDIARSLRQAEATAPGKERVNEVTAVEDHPFGRAVRHALEWVFGITIVALSLLLLVPLIGAAVTGLLALVGGRRRATPAVPAVPA